MSAALLRTLHISTPMGWRGGERQAFLLMKSLLGMGSEAYAFCPNGSELMNRCAKSDIPVHAYPKTTVFHPSFIFRLRRICRDHRIDVIHAHDPNAHTMAYLFAVVTNSKIPIVISRRVDFRPKHHWFTRRKYESRHIHKIICVSNFIKDVMENYLDQGAEKLETIHSGIDPSIYRLHASNALRQKLGLSDEDHIIGNVSALVDHKDLPTFIRTAGEVCSIRSDCSFVVIGEGPERKALNELISSLGLQSKVYLLGYQSHIRELLPQFDVFLFTSKMEGLGTSVLDAFASNVPVVATNGGGIPEMIAHGQSGMMADVGDHKTLANHVLEILDDPKLNRALVNNARKRLEHFHIERTARATFRVYRQLLENRNF